MQYHFATETYGEDGETWTLIPLQVTGFQDQTDTNFWLRLHNGTPNEIQTRDARMKTVWLNRLPMGAYGEKGRIWTYVFTQWEQIYSLPYSAGLYHLPKLSFWIENF